MNNYTKVTVTADGQTQEGSWVYTYDSDGYPTTGSATGLGSLTFQYY